MPPSTGPTDKLTPKATKLSPRPKSSRLLLLAQRKENNGVRASTERVDSLPLKKTKNKKPGKRKRQEAMMEIQQGDETPNSDNEKMRKNKYRRRRAHPDRELVLVKTARTSQV